MGALTPYTRSSGSGSLIKRLSRTGNPWRYGTRPTSHWVLFHDSPIHPFPNYTSAPSSTIIVSPTGARPGFFHRQE